MCKLQKKQFVPQIRFSLRDVRFRVCSNNRLMTHSSLVLRDMVIKPILYPYAAQAWTFEVWWKTCIESRKICPGRKFTFAPVDLTLRSQAYPSFLPFQRMWCGFISGNRDPFSEESRLVITISSIRFRMWLKVGNRLSAVLYKNVVVVSCA